LDVSNFLNDLEVHNGVSSCRRTPELSGNTKLSEGLLLAASHRRKAIITDYPFPYTNVCQGVCKRQCLSEAQVLSAEATCSKATQRVDTIQA
jgi:hypothetical protein